MEQNAIMLVKEPCSGSPFRTRISRSDLFATVNSADIYLADTKEMMLKLLYLIFMSERY